MKKLVYYLLLLIVIIPFSVQARTVSLSGNDLPYSALTGDTISFVGDTIHVGGGNATGVDGVTYFYNILLIDQQRDIDVDFGNTVFFFDTSATTSPSVRECGIIIKGSLGIIPGNVHFRGGHIISDEGGGEEVSTGKLGIYIFIARDITFDSVNVTVDGHDALCVFNERGYNNIVFNGGTFTNNSTSYSSREDFANGSIGFYQGMAQEFPSAGQYNLELNNVNVARTPHAGFYLNSSKVLVQNCSLMVDAQNIKWDTTSCFPGNCNVGQSSANCYAILLSRSAPGSKLLNNHITSSPDHQGGRGIMVQNCQGSASDSIIVAGNHVEVFRGPNGESIVGEVRVLRIRSIDGGRTDYIAVRGNTLIGIVDNSAATTAVGKSSSVLQMGLLINDLGYGHISVENNTVIARALTTGTSARAAEISIWENFTSKAQVPVVIKNNHYISSGTIVKGADIYNGRPCKFVTFDSDTLSFIDIASDSGVIDNPLTWSIGYYLFDSPGNVGLDCVYLNGASATDIEINWQARNEFALEKTIEIMINGTNDSLVDGVSLTVTNGYNQTVMSSSNVQGYMAKSVPYWFQSNAADSTSYNPFNISISKDGQTFDTTITVDWETPDITLPLNMPGTIDINDLSIDVTPPATITDLQVSP